MKRASRDAVAAATARRGDTFVPRRHHSRAAAPRSVSPSLPAAAGDPAPGVTCPLGPAPAAERVASLPASLPLDQARVVRDQRVRRAPRNHGERAAGLAAARPPAARGPPVPNPRGPRVPGPSARGPLATPAPSTSAPGPPVPGSSAALSAPSAPGPARARRPGLLRAGLRAAAAPPRPPRRPRRPEPRSFQARAAGPALAAGGRLLLPGPCGRGGWAVAAPRALPRGPSRVSARVHAGPALTPPRPQASLSLAPVNIFKAGADEERAETARLSSFVGAIAIGDLVKSTLGPKGMVRRGGRLGSGLC